MSRQRKNIRRKKVNLFSRSNLHQFCGFQFIALPAYGLNAGGGGGGSLKNHLHCCVLKSNFFSHNAKRGTWPPKKRMNERTFSAERRPKPDKIIMFQMCRGFNENTGNIRSSSTVDRMRQNTCPTAKTRKKVTSTCVITV